MHQLEECQKVNCLKGKRNQSGLRQFADWLAMTEKLSNPGVDLTPGF